MSYPKKQNCLQKQSYVHAISFPNYLTKHFAKHIKSYLILFLLMIFTMHGSGQTIRYVDRIASGLGDGSSWANKSNNLQAMIDASSPGDSVFVTIMEIFPPSATTRFHLKNGVSVYGGFVGTETNSFQRKSNAAASKFRTGWNTSINDYDRVPIFINNNLDSTTVLDGFMFNFTFGGDTTASCLQNYNSSPTIKNCKFLYASAKSDGVHPNGGAIRNFYSNPKFINCVFYDNQGRRATGDLIGTSYVGGEVMYNLYSKPTLFNCSFLNNNSSAWDPVNNTNILLAGIVIYNDQGSKIKAVNSLFYDHPVVAVKDLGTERSEITYSIAYDTIGGGPTNIEHATTYPYVDDATTNFNHDLSILWTSQAREGGDPLTNTAGYPIQIGDHDLKYNSRTKGARVDIGAYELDGETYPFITNFSNFSKTYGDADFDLGATSISPAPITYTSGNTNIVSISGSIATILKVGTVTITASQEATAGFPATSKTITLTITRASLSILGVNSSKVVGQTEPTLYYKVGANGFKYNDNASVMSGTLTRTAGETVGTYTINVGSLSAGNNYTINFTTANFYIGVSKYVKPTATGQGNATSWTDASGDLQGTIALANNGDQVWVAAGTYTSSATSKAFTLKDKVGVYGGFVGNETSLEQRNWNTNTTTLTTNQAVTGNALIDNGSVTLSSVTRLDGFTITNTYGGVMAGGMYNNNSSPTIANCIFSNNSAGTGASTTRVAAMYNDNGASPRIINSKFINNNSGLVVGAIYDTLNASPTITNVTFSNNSAALAAGVYNANGSVATITNSIFWGDAVLQIMNGANIGTATATITYSDVQQSSGTYSGTGNLNIDPVFANDFSLMSSSFVIDAGDPNTNTHILSTQANDKDLYSLIRINSDIIDMGAYEFAPTIIPVISNFTNITKTYGDANFTIGATSTSPGAIKYISSDTTIATVTNLGVVHIVSGGTITITLNQKASGNYTNKTQDISLVINKAPLDIICDTLYKAVGDPDPIFTFTIGANGFKYNDNASSLTGAISRIPAGELVGGFSTVIGTLSSRNYNFNFTSAKFYIQNITHISLADQVKTYGDSDYQLIAQSNSPGRTTYSSSDTSIVKVYGQSLNLVSLLKSGTVTITITQEKAVNYFAATATMRLTVNKAPLNIDAIPFTKRKHETDPVFTYNVGWNGNGFLRNDDASVLTGTLSRTAGEDIGTYPINIGTLASNKYYFNFNSADLTIVPNITRRYVIQNTTGDGTSWANASGNIQAMIDSSYSGDSIWIAKGNYKNTQSYIMKEGVHVFGGFKGDEDSIEKRDWLHNEVVIQSTATNQPILNYQNANLATILDGVTIKGDVNNTNAIGVKIDNSNINILNSKIINNTALIGAGIYNTCSTLNGKTLNIINSKISYNNVTQGGGAIFNKNNKIVIKNSLFQYNGAHDNSAGAIVDSTNASISIFNSTFYRNYSANGSDPFYLNPATTIVNSIILDSIENSSNYTNVNYSLVPSGIIGQGNKYIGSNTYGDVFDVIANDFTLSPRSIAIDAGDPQTNANNYSVQVGNKDLGVQNRIKWGTIDLGAYEYQSLKPTDIVFADTTTTYGNNDVELTAISNANAPIVYSISDTTNAIVYQNTTNHKWYVKAKDYGNAIIRAFVAQVDPFTDATKTIKLTINPNTLRYAKDTAQCGNLIWNNITYDKSGNYSQFFKHIRAGVDSIATMNYTYKPYPAVPVITNKIKNVFATTPQFKESVGNTYSRFTNDSANLEYAYTHQLCSNSLDTIYLHSSSLIQNTWYLNGVRLNTDTSNVLKVRNAGNYHVEVNLNGCVTPSEIDSVFTSSVVGSGLNFKDSLICKASFVPIVANAKWEGFDLNTFTTDSHVAYFKWSSQSGKFVDSVYNPKLSLPDTYYVKIFARGCLINDTVRIRNTADTAVLAKMMMTEQAFVNQNIKAVNITTLPAQKFEWILPDGISNSNMRPRIISTSDSAFVIKFTEVGGSIIGLRATSQDVCVTTDYARIAISNSDSAAVVSNQKVIIRDIVIGPNPSITGIFSMKVYLNALAPIAMRVVSISGRSYINKQINPTSKTHQESIDLSSASPGTYVVILQTANGYEIRTLLNKM